MEEWTGGKKLLNLGSYTGKEHRRKIVACRIPSHDLHLLTFYFTTSQLYLLWCISFQKPKIQHMWLLMDIPYSNHINTCMTVCICCLFIFPKDRSTKRTWAASWQFIDKITSVHTTSVRSLRHRSPAAVLCPCPPVEVWTVYPFKRKKEKKIIFFSPKNVYSTDASNEDVDVYTWIGGKKIFGLLKK